MDEEVDDEEDDFLSNSQSVYYGTFHGVYLLHCINPQYKGRTYIGYTVNPNRRINQHNAGRKKGGAWRTSGRGPWEMALIIHGFPSGISALRFEWAWQHPRSSRRLSKSNLSKRRGESAFNFCIRVLAELLRVGPWDRLPLTIQWLKQQYAVSLPVNRQPPLHMTIAYGPIMTLNPLKRMGTSNNGKEEGVSNELSCRFCTATIERSQGVTCVKSNCDLESCITCLAEIFLDQNFDSPEFVLPIKGTCPLCNTEGLWKDFVKQNLSERSV